MYRTLVTENVSILWTLSYGELTIGTVGMLVRYVGTELTKQARSQVCFYVSLVTANILKLKCME